MLTPYWAHIIGDHLGLNPNPLLCRQVSFIPYTPCTYFWMCVLGSSPHSMSPITKSCLGMLLEQGRAPTKLHQTPPGIQVPLHLESRPSYLALVFFSYVTCRM